MEHLEHLPDDLKNKKSKWVEPSNNTQYLQYIIQTSPVFSVKRKISKHFGLSLLKFAQYVDR